MLQYTAMSVQEQEKTTDVAGDELAVAPDRRDFVRRRRIGRLQRRWWGRAAISVFVCWHLFCLAMWLLPSCAIVQLFTSDSGLVRPYMTITGFMQSWLMFSPNPDRLDVYMDARITYADGAVRTWSFPRLAKMGYVQRYEQERFRKLIEVVTHNNYPMLNQSLARYVARRSNLFPRNPPRLVELMEHSRIVPPPGISIPGYTTQHFCKRVITSEDLR